MNDKFKRNIVNIYDYGWMLSIPELFLSPTSLTEFVKLIHHVHGQHLKDFLSFFSPIIHVI